MKIESKYSEIQMLGDILIFKNKVKKSIYNFKIVNTEDIERVKDFSTKFKKSMYINFYYDFENEIVEIQFENIKTSKIIDSIIVDVLD